VSFTQDHIAAIWQEFVPFLISYINSIPGICYMKVQVIIYRQPAGPLGFSTSHIEMHGTYSHFIINLPFPSWTACKHHPLFVD